MFGTIKRAPIEASVEVPGQHITIYNNFANFPQALLVMIRYVSPDSLLIPDNVSCMCYVHVYIHALKRARFNIV